MAGAEGDHVRSMVRREINPRTSTRIYCTGLGGLHLPFQCDSDFQLECFRDILTYGGSMAGQGNYQANETLYGRTPAAHQYASFLLFGVADAGFLWEVLLPDGEDPDLECHCTPPTLTPCGA